MMTAGKRLRLLREALDITQSELAEMCGWGSHSAVHFLETGQYRLTEKKMLVLAEALDVRPAAFVDDELFGTAYRDALKRGDPHLAGVLFGEVAGFMVRNEPALVSA